MGGISTSEVELIDIPVPGLVRCVLFAASGSMIGIEALVKFDTTTLCDGIFPESGGLVVFLYNSDFSNRLDFMFAKLA